MSDLDLLHENGEHLRSEYERYGTDIAGRGIAVVHMVLDLVMPDLWFPWRAVTAPSFLDEDGKARYVSTYKFGGHLHLNVHKHSDAIIAGAIAAELARYLSDRFRECQETAAYIKSQRQPLYLAYQPLYGFAYWPDGMPGVDMTPGVLLAAGMTRGLFLPGR